jgi:hypothetical protein
VGGRPERLPFDYEKSGNFKLCNYRVYANAGFGYGGALGVQVVPRFRIDASVVDPRLGARGRPRVRPGLDVGASLRAPARCARRIPRSSVGSMDVKIKLPVVPDIDVTVPNLRLALR